MFFVSLPTFVNRVGIKKNPAIAPDFTTGHDEFKAGFFATLAELEIGNFAVTEGDLASDAVTVDKIAQNGAEQSQVGKSSFSHFLPR